MKTYSHKVTNMNLDHLIPDQLRRCFIRFPPSLFLYISHYSKYNREKYEGKVHSPKLAAVLCKNDKGWIETLNTKVVGNGTVLKDLRSKLKSNKKLSLDVRTQNIDQVQ